MNQTQKTQTNEMNLTVKQLRQILFNLEDQEMTVKQLRKRLFYLNNQDEKITDSPEMWVNLGVE